MDSSSLASVAIKAQTLPLFISPAVVMPPGAPNGNNRPDPDEPSQPGTPVEERPTNEERPLDRGMMQAPTQEAPLQAALTKVLLTNRVREVLWHIPWYAFKTQARLAQDSGVSPAAISRLIRGESQPSLVVALHVTQALSRRLGRPLDVNEVFSLDGTYPTPSVCHLSGCHNCLPEHFYDEQEQIKPAFQGVAAGSWSMAPAFNASASISPTVDTTSAAGNPSAVLAIIPTALKEQKGGA